MKINQAIERLKEEGYKYTDKREKILQFFIDNNRYLAAKDVLEHLKEDFPGLSYDTIYRNLYLFAELNILEATDMSGEKHFRFKCDTDHHHHHFICVDCGKTKHIHLCPMSQVENDLTGFSIIDHKFEVYGKCPECL